MDGLDTRDRHLLVWPIGCQHHAQLQEMPGCPRPQYVHARPFGRTKQRSNTTPNERGRCQ